MSAIQTPTAMFAQSALAYRRDLSRLNLQIGEEGFLSKMASYNAGILKTYSNVLSCPNFRFIYQWRKKPRTFSFFLILLPLFPSPQKRFLYFSDMLDLLLFQSQTSATFRIDLSHQRKESIPKMTRKQIFLRMIYANFTIPFVTLPARKSFMVSVLMLEKPKWRCFAFYTTCQVSKVTKKRNRNKGGKKLRRPQRNWTFFIFFSFANNKIFAKQFQFLL